MRSLVFLFVCVFLAIPCEGRIITVDDDGPADFNNIQAAIDDANNGDIVEVQPGIYTGNGNRDIDFSGKPITVRGTDPNDPNVVAATVIDCNGAWMDGHRGFHFHGGEDCNSVLSGLSIKNGLAWGEDGGGILIENSSPTIQNCVISDNSTYFAGMGDLGGGICCKNSSNPVIVNCAINDNSAGGGGGIFCWDSTPKVVHCTVANNSGGGVYCWQGAAEFQDCLITDNIMDSTGGGILLLDDNSSLNNCTVRANRAWHRGGGISCGNNSGPTITNCIIVGNRAADPFQITYGGGIESADSSPTITNCTISGNYADYGGALSTTYSSVVVSNCIFWDNSNGQVDLGIGSSINIIHSDVQGGWAGLGNIDVDPCFVELGYWDANGTPNDVNDDFWMDGDYHLKSEGWRWNDKWQEWDFDRYTSRCIDAGNPGSSLGEELLSVPEDPNNEWGQNLRINMGAYGGTAEASMPPYDWALLADCTNDGTVDFMDFAHLTTLFGQQDDELPGDFDRDGEVDLGDVALLTEDWLRETTWHRQ